MAGETDDRDSLISTIVETTVSSLEDDLFPEESSPDLSSQLLDDGGPNTDALLTILEPDLEDDGDED